MTIISRSVCHHWLNGWFLLKGELSSFAFILAKDILDRSPANDNFLEGCIRFSLGSTKFRKFWQCSKWLHLVQLRFEQISVEIPDRKIICMTIISRNVCQHCVNGWFLLKEKLSSLAFILAKDISDRSPATDNFLKDCIWFSLQELNSPNGKK